MANSKRTLFLKRRLRVRNKLRKINTGKPRLSIHRSSKNISVQVIDDVQGITLASASTLDKSLGLLAKITWMPLQKWALLSPSVLEKRASR